MGTPSHDEPPLVVGVLNPPDFDPGQLAARLAACPRPVELMLGDYADSWEVLTARDQRRPRAEFEHLMPPLGPETVQILADAEVIMSRDVPLDVGRVAPRLRYLQGTGAGVSHLDIPELAGLGVRVAHAAGVQAGPIAEFAFARLLEVWKGLRHFEDAQRRHGWERLSGDVVAGKTIGIVGLGAIGSELARRAKGFDLQVVATRRRYRPGQAAPYVDELLPAEALDRLLGRADAVVLCVPVTDETRALIGAREFGLMKSGAVLCNVARGALVDETALLAALGSGHLRAAVLDVMKAEPLPPDSPLWDAPHVYLSPHSSNTQDGANDRLANLFAANIVRYSTGQLLINERDPAAGY